MKTLLGEVEQAMRTHLNYYQVNQDEPKREKVKVPTKEQQEVNKET